MNLLFTAGTARGGTNLRSFALNSNPEIAISIDALLPLFKYYRHRIVFSELWNQSSIPPDWMAPLPDLFNNQEGSSNFVKFVNGADDIEIPLPHWEFLRPEIIKRSSLASGAITKKIGEISSRTFSEAIYQFATIVSETYSNGNARIVGFQENWIAEFFLPLSRVFPEAKFISYVRDPRAVLHSSENHEPDTTKHPAIFSMARHVRKNLALTISYTKAPTLLEKFYFTRYEDFFTNIAAYSSGICEFLGVKESPLMFEFSQYKDGFCKPIATPFKVYSDATSNWKSDGNMKINTTAEFINQSEMRYFGYLTTCDSNALTVEIQKFLTDNMSRAMGWKEFEKDLSLQIDWEHNRLTSFQSISSEKAFDSDIYSLIQSLGV